MDASWSKVEARWPARLVQGALDFEQIKDGLVDFLTARGVIPRAFSHFGIVLEDIKAAGPLLSEPGGQAWVPACQDWVESFGVFVARGNLAGVEIEFIQPVGQSFFAQFMHEAGPGLHHLSYQVHDIEDSIRKLAAAGTPIIGGGVRLGSHGKIAFCRPQEFTPLCLELCQPREHD